MLLNIILLIVGFVLLIKGADVFVEGSSKVAALLHIPQIVIGLTIVAFGTSAPEAAVSIASSYQGTSGIAIGNIIGSNIANVLLILGVAGMIGDLVVKKNTFFIETPFVIVITIVLLFLGYTDRNVSRLDGVILWIFFILFLFYLYRLTKHGDESSIDDVPELEEDDRIWKLILMIVLGIICVVIGSRVTVDAASQIAEAFGVSDRIIGLTIVSIGTSLPELVTSVSASFKGRNDIAIGNIIGSNIFNILFVLGTASLVAPQGIAFASGFLIDGIIAIGAVMMFMLFIGKDMKLKKYGAFIMLISYVCYLVYIL
ncbi:calcium/sodium antiporter [Candidatus Stoquefichus massiliensis]|uniref:calcium/sodium antiporter n=1 Tax=Candidatus Stoquefichus massiliensis TaxID=1470350 RepID=UPI0004898185|nr:calcium/sodium antiporter [Candidatus Stoquefichus massiliensis]